MDGRDGDGDGRATAELSECSRSFHDGEKAAVVNHMTACHMGHWGTDQAKRSRGQRRGHFHSNVEPLSNEEDVDGEGEEELDRGLDES